MAAITRGALPDGSAAETGIRRCGPVSCAGRGLLAARCALLPGREDVAVSDPLDEIQGMTEWAGEGCSACLADIPHDHGRLLHQCPHYWGEVPPDGVSLDDLPNCCFVEVHIGMAYQALVMEAHRVLRERRRS